MVMDSSQDLLEDEICNTETLSSRWKQFILNQSLGSKTTLPKTFPLSVKVEVKKTSIDGYIDDGMRFALQLP